jgi:PAS domain S-box-containing protein
MLWLYLLGLVTLLVIALRRVLRRQKPLSDELYSKQVAINHVHSGVAWVRADGTIGTVNPSLLATLGADSAKVIGRDWLEIFPMDDRDHLREAYRQMLLAGKISLETQARRFDGTLAEVSVLLVVVHDHKTRLIGHYCLLEDCAKIHQLQKEIRALTEAQSLSRHDSGQTTSAR